MAATRLIPMHINKNHTMGECIKARTDYAANPEKTEKGELVTGYECNPLTVDEEFLLSKTEYEHKTGRRFVGALKDETNDVIAYQIRQSFKPGEITPEEANRVGYETAMRFTKGKHAFIVATHTDKAHIHNHIIFNSTNLACDKKFRNFKLSAIALQRVSDIVCFEHGLSIIPWTPYRNRAKKSVEHPKRDSFRDFICSDIDDILKKKPSDFEQFLKMMEDAEYECKRGKNIAFRGKNQKRFVRMRSLGANYSEEAIRAVIEGGKEHQSKFNDSYPRPERPLKLLIDVDAKRREKGDGYARWATNFNSKQIAEALMYVRTLKINSLEELKEISEQKSAAFYEKEAKIKAMEERIKQIDVHRKHIRNYHNTRQVYIDYRKAGYSKKFYEEHRQAITLHKAAKDFFDELGDHRPTLKELEQERAALLSAKKELAQNYYPERTEMRDLALAYRNLDTFLNGDKDADQREKEKEKNKKERRQALL